MQLTTTRSARAFAVAVLVSTSISTWTSTARGDTSARARTAVGGYQDSVATAVLTPSVGGTVESPTAGWGVDGNYLVDVVSAASPDIVSTASRRFVEVRHAGGLSGRYKPGEIGGGAGASVSSTPDYLSLTGNGRILVDLDSKNLVLGASYTYGHDVIGRTGTPFSVFSRQFDFHVATFTLTRILNPKAVLSFVGDLGLDRGDQSKPYRYIPLFAPSVAPSIRRGASPDTVAAALDAKVLEHLPLARERYALTGRLAYRLTESTLRIEERLYADSWSLVSTTTDLRWMMDVGSRFIVWPHLRIHVQNAVSFWERAYVSTGPADVPALRTGDRELGSLYNIGSGLGVRWALGREDNKDSWVATATADGTYTSFADAIYVRERYAILGVLGLEAAF